MVNVKAGSALKEAREKKHYSQQGLANDLGIHYRTIWRYEKGDFPDNRSETVKRIDKLLGTKLFKALYE